MIRRITNRHLARLLAAGYGQVRYKDWKGKEVVKTFWIYNPKEDDSVCDVEIRSWDSIKWKLATEDIYEEYMYFTY